MSKKYFIKHSNLPPRFPLVGTVFWWMFLDYINAPGWVFGVVGTFLIIMWYIFFVEILTKQGKDVFQENEEQ